MRARAASRSFPARSAARSRTCSARRSRACWRTGTARARAASIPSSARSATSSPRTSRIPAPSISPASSARRRPAGCLTWRARRCRTATGSSPAACSPASIRPGADDEATRKRIGKLLDAGIDCFIDLTEPRRARVLRAAARRRRAAAATIAYLRRPIRDHGRAGIATRAMREILDALDARAGRRPVACTCTAAPASAAPTSSPAAGSRAAAAAAPPRSSELNRQWRGNARSRTWPTMPETDGAGRVRPRLAAGPRRAARAGGPPRRAAAATAGVDLRDRVRGMLLGLAAGDALGHAVHGLPAGAWSDKTAMALCLADSLVSQRRARRRRPGRALPRVAARRPLVEHRQLRRHQRRRRRARSRRRSGPAIPMRARTIPRTPTPSRSRASARPSPGFSATPRAAIDAAVNCARVTHQAPLTLDAVRFLAALLAGALAGAGTRTALLAADFSPSAGGLEPGHAALRRCARSRPAPGAAARRAGCCAASSRQSPRSSRRSRPSRAGADLAQCLAGRGLAPGRCADGRRDRRPARGRATTARRRCRRRARERPRARRRDRGARGPARSTPRRARAGG